jgi:hypothetical protein
MLRENSRYYLRRNQAQPYVSFAKVLPNMRETLGELIQRRMKDLGIRSNSQLAKMIGVSSAYAGDLINDKGKTQSGTYKPGPEVVVSLAKVLEIEISDILTATGYTDGLDPKQAREVHDLMAKVKVTFLDDTFSQHEKDAILDMMRTLIAGAMAGKNNKD